MSLKDFAFSQEPAAWIAAANAVLILAVSFGLPLTSEQKTAIIAVVTIGAGLLIRTQVTPTANLPLPLR
jgi:hypothetical protein